MKTSKMCVLGGVFAACLAAGAETPDRFIRYVEATGAQAVDVGVRGRYGTKMEASIEWTALADMSILDAREDPNTHSRIADYDWLRHILLDDSRFRGFEAKLLLGNRAHVQGGDGIRRDERDRDDGDRRHEPR